MIQWQNANRAEKRQLEAITIFLRHSPQLLDFLFETDFPKLNDSPAKLLAAASGLPSSDFLLVRLALNLWCGGGEVQVHEIFDAEPEVLRSILKSLTLLSA